MAISFLIGFVIWTMYVRSQALQPPSRSWAESAHCDVIYCCANWPIHGFKMPTHESRSKRALHNSQVLRIMLSRQITVQNALFRILKAWFERALHSQRVKSGFQIRKGSESRSETAFGTWFAPLWTGPVFNGNPTKKFHITMVHCYWKTMIVACVGSLDSPLFFLCHKFGTVCEFDRKRKPSNQEHCLSRVEYLGNDPVTPPMMSNYIEASRDTYPFFGVTLTRIHHNKINHILIQTSYKGQKGVKYDGKLEITESL